MSFPRNFTPSIRSILLRTCWLGIALDCSYSLTTCCFSLISRAKSACVNSLAILACCMTRATSLSTLSWCNSSVSRSNTAVFFADSCCLLLPAENFFDVSIATPARWAAAIAASDFNSPERGARLPANDGENDVSCGTNCVWGKLTDHSVLIPPDCTPKIGSGFTHG